MDTGEWHGPCEQCGTSHEGFPPDTMGGAWRCLAGRADLLAAACTAPWQQRVRRHALAMAKNIRESHGWWTRTGVPDM